MNGAGAYDGSRSKDGPELQRQLLPKSFVITGNEVPAINLGVLKDVFSPPVHKRGLFCSAGVQLMEYNLVVAVVLNSIYRETQLFFDNQRQLRSQNGCPELQTWDGSWFQRCQTSFRHNKVNCYFLFVLAAQIRYRRICD